MDDNGISMIVYCLKCDDLHKITSRRAERLIYQYQLRIVEAAITEPLPSHELTERDLILRNAFCVNEDDTKDNLIPQWKQHVETLLGKRRNLANLSRQAQVRRNRQQKVRNT
jgi:hypothetical protein